MKTKSAAAPVPQMPNSITITAAELLACEPALVKLNSSPLHPLAAFRVAVLIGKLSTHLAAATAAKLTSFRKYGTEKDGQISVPPEHMPDLITDLDPFLRSSVTIDTEKIPLSLLESAPSMTPAEMATLAPFITTV